MLQNWGSKWAIFIYIGHISKLRVYVHEDKFYYTISDIEEVASRQSASYDTPLGAILRGLADQCHFELYNEFINNDAF